MEGEADSRVGSGGPVPDKPLTMPGGRKKAHEAHPHQRIEGVPSMKIEGPNSLYGGGGGAFFSSIFQESNTTWILTGGFSGCSTRRQKKNIIARKVAYAKVVP